MFVSSVGLQYIETGMMDWNILILSSLVLLAGLALVLIACKWKAVTGKKLN